ncbi:MAG: hypothetical protein ACE5IT_03490 [bacterium]
MIKVKRYLAIFIMALVVLGITTGAFCYEAEVIDISGTKYFPAVKEALSKAEESIYLVMFIIKLSPYEERSKANQLVDELIKAQMRVGAHNINVGRCFFFRAFEEFS